jgi:hypothetical protein
MRKFLFIAAGLVFGLGLLRAAIEFPSTSTTQTTTSAPASSATTQGGAAPADGTVTTNVNATGSDALDLGLLGTSALFALMAAFYTRISSVTLPGGLGFALTAPDAQKLTKKVVEKLRTSLPRGAGDADEKGKATIEESANKAGTASVLASRYAQELLRLAGSEGLLQARANELGIADQSDLAALARGEINDHITDRLASAALAHASVTV